MLAGCATLPPVPRLPDTLPVLLVHGIDDSSRGFSAMRARLARGGWAEVDAIDLTPNDGSSGIPALAAQVQRGVERLRARTGAAKVDVVAFSMGALVTRWYLMRLGGATAVRKFVSLSGPHHGTLLGYLRWNAGGEQMRPHSPLLDDLARDEGQWGGVEVLSFWTPLDVMIVPASSSRLEGAAHQTFPVLVHPLMLCDGRVLDAVEAALAGRFAQQPGARAPQWP